jgi:protein-disulfide isomerase
MRLLPLLVLGLIGVCHAAPPAAKPPAKTAFDKATFEAYVRHVFLWPPQVTVTVAEPTAAPFPGFKLVKVTGAAGAASQEETFYVSNDGQKILRGQVFDVTKSPFEDDLQKLKTDFQPSLGTAGAPVVIVLFSDFQCPMCKEEAKTIRENVIKAFPKDVRLYFKDLPLEAIHPWAKPGAMAGRCVFRQNPQAFWDYHDWIYEKQAEVTPENLRAKVLEWGTAKGLDTIQLGRCIDTKATETDVNKSIAEAKALRINATPTLFINGRRLEGNLPWQNLKAIIDWDLDYAKKTGTGGEQCCEVRLPSPLNK